MISIRSKKNDKRRYSKKELCPYLRFGNSYENTKVEKHQVVQAIIHRLKTGCQWRELPMKQFFAVEYKWQAVYYHFRKWSSDGSWEKLWKNLLSKHKSMLDLSSIQLDGTHTIVKRGGEKVGYQGRKKSKTTNLLMMTDNRGTPLACSDPIAGNHHDSHNLVATADKMVCSVDAAGISTEGLFLNADAGFDHKAFRVYCDSKEIIHNIDKNQRNGNKEEYLFDALLYRCRFVIERTNAWLDAFKALLVRFETKQLHWRALHLIAFSVILLRRL